METAGLAVALHLGVQAFLVGLSGAMSPGSFLTVTIARTMRRGALSAALLLAGHALLEAALLFGFAFGLQRILRLPEVALVLALVGGAVLLYMGYGLVKGAITRSILADLEDSGAASISAGPLSAVLQGAVVSISNPWWTLWWATIGVKLASDGLSIGPVGVLAFFVGHQLADVAWYSFVIAAVHKGRGLLTPRSYCTIMGVLGLVLLYIGARFISQPFGLDLPWLAL